MLRKSGAVPAREAEQEFPSRARPAKGKTEGIERNRRSVDAAADDSEPTLDLLWPSNDGSLSLSTGSCEPPVPLSCVGVSAIHWIKCIFVDIPVTVEVNCRAIGLTMGGGGRLDENRSRISFGKHQARA